jgi:streptogramin lyase
MSIATSPGSVWVVSRRRSILQRVDAATGQPVRSLPLPGRGADIEYHAGAVWIPSPRSDAVYKVLTKTGAIIPIGVGAYPRQVAIGAGRVYVTNYSSSGLSTIDEKRLRPVGDAVSLPVNPYALAVGRGAVWVASQPGNTLSEVTGPAG